MEIRILDISSYKEMIQLWNRAELPVKPRGRDSKQAIAAQMKADPDFFIGAFETSRLIGTVIITSDGRKGWINRLAVDPESRRHGVARDLITESEKVLRKKGIKIFCALIETHNASSKKLFKKCGYTEHGGILYFSKRDSTEV